MGSAGERDVSGPRPLRLELVGGAAVAELVPPEAGIDRRHVAAGPARGRSAYAPAPADMRIVDLDAGKGALAALARAAEPGAATVVVAVSRKPSRAAGALAAGATDFALVPRDSEWLRAIVRRERDRLRRSPDEPERLVVEIPRDGLRLVEYERAVVENALTRAGWNRSRAARELGVSRPRLLRMIERHGLAAPPCG
jgi:DNA-binding NtrC family response regulator